MNILLECLLCGGTQEAFFKKEPLGRKGEEEALEMVKGARAVSGHA